MATMTIRGTASVPVEPDEAMVGLVVSALMETPQAAYAAVGERAQLLVAVCDELGIDPRKRQTTGIAVAEQVEWVEGVSQSRGHRATSRLHVRVAGAELVARLLQEAVERAQASVEGPWWTVDPGNPARFDACREAVANAQRKAQAYADGLGLRLAGIRRVRETGVAPAGRGAAAFAAIDIGEIPVQPGELSVSAAVDVTFLLE